MWLLKTWYSSSLGLWPHLDFRTRIAWSMLSGLLDHLNLCQESITIRQILGINSRSPKLMFAKWGTIFSFLADILIWRGRRHSQLTDKKHMQKGLLSVCPSSYMLFMSLNISIFPAFYIGVFCSFRALFCLSHFLSNNNNISEATAFGQIHFLLQLFFFTALWSSLYISLSSSSQCAYYKRNPSKLKSQYA